jgi:ammonia channel protein AmtB
MLQSDYNYIGYFLYVSLFIGTFFGILSGFRDEKKDLKVSVFFNFLYVVLVSYYPIGYYLKNGIWLY